jgi:anti-sigma regulatory factor (Ser/Thr protein kinase)
MIANRVPSETGLDPAPGGLSTSWGPAPMEDPARRRSAEPRHGRERGGGPSSPSSWSDRTDSRPEAPARADRGARDPLVEGRAEAESSFLLENDPAQIPPLLARLRETAARLGLFDGDTAGRVAVALTEALLNGMQHGNLELDSRLRQDDATYERITEFRRRRAPYRDRRLHVRARLTPREAVYVIRDEGPGFDPARVPDPTAPAQRERASGRGLLLIRAFMDEVAFNGAGNQITLIKRRTTAPETR